MSIARWDPFGELSSLRERMSSLLEEGFLRPVDGRAADGGMNLPLDVAESDDAFVIKSSLPGVKPENLEITIQGTTLTIRGESENEEQREGLHWHLRERRLGSFSRSVHLGSEINADGASAHFDQGVLTLTVPKNATTKRRKIEVTTEPAAALSDRPAQPEQERPRASQASNQPKSTAGKPEPTASTTAEQAREAQEAETARQAVGSSRERMVDIGRGNQQAGRQRS